MHQQLPKEIDPFRLASNGLRLEGNLSLAIMPRLSATIVDSQGDVEVNLKFDVDETGTPYMKGNIKTTLPLTCERCLQTMQYNVDTALSVGFIRHERQAEHLAESYEPWLIEGDKPVALSSIVEDELLLAIPIVPKHEHACLPEDLWQSGDEIIGGEEEKSESPFAVLAALKKKD
jgi:uncharacterized protein